jgi:hypothetical protein
MGIIWKTQTIFQKDFKLLKDTQGKSVTHLATKEKQMKRTMGYHFSTVKLARFSANTHH